MRRSATLIGRCTAALSLGVLLAAHVGSPDVYYVGKAGPYTLDVVIRPPQVVPGIAEVFVRVHDSQVTRVVLRPVFWRAGSKGAPAGDEARPVTGVPGAFTGPLWLMATGSYSVHVNVTGAVGLGDVLVPVASVATGQLALSPLLTWLLAILGTLLVAGVITAVYAAAGESQVAPGETMPPERRRRARIAAAAAVPVMAFVVLGAANWWDSEAQRYKRTLYRPVPTRSTVADVAGTPTLTMRITDPSWGPNSVTPLVPDHGKLVHLFVAGVDPPYAFAHLHPEMPNGKTMVTPLPPFPAGRYRVFADVVHETGFQRTFVDSFALAASLGAAGAAKLSPDEAWSTTVAARVGGNASSHGPADRVFVDWAGPTRPSANQPGALRFVVRDKRGAPVTVDPYLGMLGHAVVIREDGKVFVHLHPSGTSSRAAQIAFALRDRGDTTAEGRLRVDAAPMSNMSAATTISEISFPYAFPSVGRYRVWVQLRVAGEVHTSAFDVDVADGKAR